MVDLRFLDTVSGDAVVALRDNKGRSLETGPLEHFVTVHPRMIQLNTARYDAIYGSKQDRISRLTVMSMSNYEIQGMDPGTDVVLAITDMFVLPTGAGDKRRPWILLSTIMGKKDESAPPVATTIDEDAAQSISPQQTAPAAAIQESYRRDVCIGFDVNSLVEFVGKLQQTVSMCELNSFFEVARDAGYSPVVMHKENSLMEADVALLPSRKGFDMCIMNFKFSSLSSVAPVQTKSCFTTPDSFVTGANMPLRDSWSDIQREMFLGVNGNTVSRTSQGTVVVGAKRIVSQNTLNSYTPEQTTLLQMFATGDPGASTHWLKQIRIGIHVDDATKSKYIVSAQSRHSLQVQTSVVTYHSCNRRSCLGCGTLRLQALCYTAQQCSVVSCIGTVVNQNRPLCNVGLVMKSYAEGTLSMMLGAWLIFTETYTGILDAALLGPSKSTSIGWVDDAFFGYICSAKVHVLRSLCVVIRSQF